MLIPVGCAIMDFLRSMRRPGSMWLAAAVVALGGVNVARERQWPRESWWEPGGWGQLAFIVLSLVVSVGTFLVIVGFRRILKRQRASGEFATAAESFAQLVEANTSMHRNQFGVNIWLVKGMLGFRRLVREATVVGYKRHETPITWTKGKGIIGEAWGRKKGRVADLDAVRATFWDQTTWCELKRSDRFRLSWDEFNETRRYRAVLAVPLRRHRWARHPVKGVAAIDSLVPGKAAELNELYDMPEFSSVRRTCEAAFRSND